MWRLTGSVVFVLLAAVVALGCFFMSRPTSSAEPDGGKKESRTEFASDRGGADPAPFDAKRAMGYLDDLCAIGPRISGTEGMTKQQDMLKKHFEDLGATVELQKFTARQKSQKQPVEMANLIVSWNPERERRVILCSHYDTRPIADQEDDRRNWNKPFVSANDGGSGVALLMELGHHMKDLKTNVGVDFVFFDGEEYVFDRDDEYFFGSKHFGREYRKARGPNRYLAAILLDMVGGKDAHFPIEQNSWFKASALVRSVWGVAADLKATAFRADALSDVAVEDDHIPLNQSGIPAIDIIDFKYPHWHKLTDLPENCSGETLEQVARVLSVWLQRMK
jgi:hypothetical protein